MKDRRSTVFPSWNPVDFFVSLMHQYYLLNRREGLDRHLNSNTEELQHELGE